MPDSVTTSTRRIHARGPPTRSTDRFEGILRTSVNGAESFEKLRFEFGLAFRKGDPANRGDHCRVVVSFQAAAQELDRQRSSGNRLPRGTHCGPQWSADETCFQRNFWEARQRPHQHAGAPASGEIPQQPRGLCQRSRRCHRSVVGIAAGTLHRRSGSRDARDLPALKRENTKWPPCNAVSCGNPTEVRPDWEHSPVAKGGAAHPRSQ